MKRLKKLISLIMSVVLVLALLPVTPAFAETDGNTFKCAWFNETLTYPYEYSDGYFSGSSLEYNHDLATFSLCVAMSSFNSFDKTKGDEHIRTLLTECGYTVDSYGYDTEDYDTVGVAFGRKLIDGYNVVIAAIRSGNYGMEWGGNVRVGGGTGDHEGFRICRDLLIGYMNTYFKEHPCIGKTKLLIPGYSRGASAANLFAAALDDGTYTEVLTEQDYIAGVDVEELYVYTFEAPQCTTSKNVHDDIYNNIFNIVNPNDYVPLFVMDEWGFSLYGKRVELPCADNCDNYEDYYRRVCTEFDSFMKPNGRKAKKCFCSEEDSRSVETTLNCIFRGLGSDVMQNRDYYHENYEGSLIFFLGQYLGRQRKIDSVLKTMFRLLAANAVSLLPSNMNKIKTDGYKKYIASYLAARNGGELSEHDIEGTVTVLTELMKYLNANRKNVISLASQLNAVAEVHQPYIALSWMRALNENDIRAINGSFDHTLRLSCTKMALKCDVDGKIVARHDENAGHIEWKSDRSDVASVDENGIVHTCKEGNAVITATLKDSGGKQLAEQSVKLTVKKNFWDRVGHIFDK